MVRLLADFIEGQLPPHEHAELELHLSRCPACLAHVKTYRCTVSLLRTINDDDLPQELRCTLKSFLDRNCHN
jgi:anti-sigma factor RsiW